MTPDPDRPTLRFRTLHASPLVSIVDVSCRPEGDACGAEEQASGNEIVFPRAGSFLMHVGAKRVLADANHVVFFNRSEPYRVSHPRGAGDACTALRFAQETLDEAWWPSGGLPAARFPRTHAPMPASSSLALHALRRRACATRADPLAVEEAALNLLSGMVKGSSCRPRVQTGARAAARRLLLVERIRLRIADALDARLSLEGIAGEVGASPFHLARIFREETGLPIHRYRSRLRLREALDRLAQGEDDLTRLALDLGYASHSHFTDAFRAAFGLSPSAFRNGSH